MRRLIPLALILFGCFGSALAAESAALPEVLQALERPFRSDPQQAEGARIDDFQAEFLQQSHIASIDRTQHGAGSVSFRFIRDGAQNGSAMFRWEYREPAPQEIVSDGRTMWFYLPENRQVIESDMSKLSSLQGENPITFLSALGNLGRDFSVDWAEPSRDSDGNPVLALRPLKESQYINRLEVVVSQQAVDAFVKQHKTGSLFPIVSTAVIDPSGNRTAISFHKVSINRGLAKEIFRFQTPAGVEVVRPSAQGPGY